MRLDHRLNNLKELIDKKLDAYLPAPSSRPGIIHKAMRHSVFSGGKRIRPVLVLEACRACGGEISSAMPIACAVELVHAFSLVHDDLPSMDDDDYRRGKPSCHKAFGEASAILAGDALLILAFNIIAKGTPRKSGIAAITVLSDAIGTKGMTGGQAADIGFKDIKKNADTMRYINHLKTAKLFEASARLGAVAANASGDKAEAMSRYGAFLGMAFQTVDDIMDHESYAEIAGGTCALRDAQALTKRAKNALRPFGKRADFLNDIADRVLAQVK